MPDYVRTYRAGLRVRVRVRVSFLCSRAYIRGVLDSPRYRSSGDVRRNREGGRDPFDKRAKNRQKETTDASIAFRKRTYLDLTFANTTSNNIKQATPTPPHTHTHTPTHLIATIRRQERQRRRRRHPSAGHPSLPPSCAHVVVVVRVPCAPRAPFRSPAPAAAAAAIAAAAVLLSNLQQFLEDLAQKHPGSVPSPVKTRP